MSTLRIKGSPVFEKNRVAPGRIIVNQGGTRSGKTFAILQLLLFRAVHEKLHISICSLSLPHLKRGALKDWIEILENYGLYSDGIYNRSDHSFKLANSFIEFFSLDNPAKARGPARDVLFVNEANLIPWETFRQLLIRTRKEVYIDYNPADEFHWIYDNVLTRKDVTFIQSTYRDNPFLPKEMIREIERYKEHDENFWRVFGLGERGISQAVIYNHWNPCHKLPENGEDIYGLDFGFNNPTALIHIRIYDNAIYANEILYQSHLTNADLIRRLQELIPRENRLKVIYADAAEPNRIEEIRRAGFNVKAADKDVKKGIDSIKGRPLFIASSSANLLKEIKSYKWKEDDNGRTIDEPIKLNDHAMDALRYAVHTYFNKPQGVYAVR